MKKDEELKNKITSLAQGGYLPRETFNEIIKNSLLQKDYFLDKRRIKELNDLINKIETLWNSGKIL